MPGPVTGIKPASTPSIQTSAAPAQNKGPANQPPAAPKNTPATGKGSKINVLA